VTRQDSKIAVCFVCLGNICRSPIAEGVFRQLVAEAGLTARFDIDSAGTSGYHAGVAPDRRARAAGQRAGVVVQGAARQFEVGDFARFDYVVAMDESNRQDLRRLAQGLPQGGKIRLLRSFDPGAPDNAPVPDPYYGEEVDFDHVVELCRTACRHLLEEIRRERVS
jgi:low molecular weight protein-tyrosine phosphatase